MGCLYTTKTRPARTARVARKLWDWTTERDGAPPQDLSLLVSEGRFREWMWIGADGELGQMDSGIVGGGGYTDHRYPWDRPKP